MDTPSPVLTGLIGERKRERGRKRLNENLYEIHKKIFKRYRITNLIVKKVIIKVRSVSFLWELVIASLIISFFLHGRIVSTSKRQPGERESNTDKCILFES